MTKLYFVRQRPVEVNNTLWLTTKSKKKKMSHKCSYLMKDPASSSSG